MRHLCIADTHFGHDKLVKAGLKSKNEDSKVLTSLVTGTQGGDILFHLGDFCFYNNEFWNSEFMQYSNASKYILVLGNHDRKTNSWYYGNGWDFVCNEFTLKAYGCCIVFSHKPVICPKGALNVHGHYHTNHNGNKLPKYSRLVYNKLIDLRKVIGK